MNKPREPLAKPSYSSRNTLLAALVICLTTAGSLVLSHVRMMWADEFLSFWGDRLPTAADVINVQLHYPISLDPPTYHLLAHWSMRLFGQGALGMRAPALLGVVLSQITLFLLVRRIAGGRAAVLAAALPAAFGPFWYSAEGRPYGWLLGMYGIAMLCWYSASDEWRVMSGERNQRRSRMLALIGLTLAIAGAITSHYFGVLILLPLAAGEAVRTVERRRLDWPVVLALAFGASSIALILPFQHALVVFKQHYYNRDVTAEAITLGYTNAVSQSHVVTYVFLLLIAVLGVLRFRKRAGTEPAALWAMLLTLALMPVWCFLFERFVTHSMEGRYAIPASLAFVVAIAIVLGPWLRKNTVFYGVLGVIVLAGLGSIAVKIRREHRYRQDFYSGAYDLVFRPGQHLYVNSFGNFLQDQYYAPPDLQKQIAYVYDAQEEIRWKGRDTHSISADNVRHYAPELQLVPYSQFLNEPGPQLVLIYDVKDWEWLPADFAERHITVQSLGTLMLGKLESADTHPSGMAQPASSQ